MIMRGGIIIGNCYHYNDYIKYANSIGLIVPQTDPQILSWWPQRSGSHLY
jgi:hypothetical protein